MDAIQLSNKLQATGLERKSAEVIAQAFNEHNDEIATKSDIKGIRKLMYFAFALMGAGIGYLAALIHSVINKF